MDKETFEREILKLGIDLDENKLNKLDKFYKFLIEKNKVMNLTAITDEKEVYLKHFYDSLTICRVIDLKKYDSLCDVGSGAGFPGIVLKIFFPHLKITLIDSLNKRVNYLNQLISVLSLEDIKAKHIRMEDFSKDNEEKFDLITARAVASTSLLSEISVKALKIKGKLLLYKGIFNEEEEISQNLLQELSLKIELIEKFNLILENSQRSLVILSKEKKTKAKYPRMMSEIKKELL